MPKALTLKQPWAWLVIHGPKDIENRRWNTGFRGRFYVHTSKQHLREDYEQALGVARAHGVELPPFDSPVYECGGIIGSAVLDDVLPPWSQARPWKFEGNFGFVLSDRMSLPFTACAGALNFWRIPEAVELALASPQPAPRAAPRLQPQLGKFYKSKEGDVWCCYKARPLRGLYVQSWCVRLKDDFVNYFLDDHSFDPGGEIESELVDVASEEDIHQAYPERTPP